jgi:uncharacterized membrane protein YdjX (TVP38/TMEM64 family)
MRRLLPLVLLALVAAGFLAGSEVRDEMSLDLTPSGIQSSLQGFVAGLGVKGPMIYVAVVVFRSFLLLPSLVVLTVGGLVFGAAFGTLLGGLGIALSATINFALARGVGRDWIQRHHGERLRGFEERIKSAGPALVGLATAHPMGPLSPSHIGAGLASVDWLPFVTVVLIAGPVRAFVYSFFGANLPEPASPQFIAATAVMVAVAVLPLAHRGFRARLFGVGKATPGLQPGP